MYIVINYSFHLSVKCPVRNASNHFYQNKRTIAQFIVITNVYITINAYGAFKGHYDCIV